MNATEIVDGLWMGGSQFPLLAHGFDCVVNCKELEDLSLPFPKAVAVLWVPFVDGPELPDDAVLRLSQAFVAESLYRNKKVLVHCAEGHNRSGLVVANFLIEIRGMPSADVIALIRGKRPGALSNQTFVDHLMGEA